MRLASCLRLNPGYATAHQWHAWHLLVTGRTNEGLLELRTAYSLDPLSLIISADLADALCIAHRLDESVKQSQRTLEFDPNFALGHYQLGQAYEQQALHERAIVAGTRVPGSCALPATPPSPGCELIAGATMLASGSGLVMRRCRSGHPRPRPMNVEICLQSRRVAATVRRSAGPSAP
jgi:hypothetical protein